jgi:membrane peptidoglycan carboxypeptidase
MSFPNVFPTSDPDPPSAEADAAAPSPIARRWGLRIGIGLLVAAGALVVEARTSWLQSWAFSQLADRMTYTVEPGPAPDFSVPTHGPYNERLGYTRLPERVDALTARGFDVDAQARPSASFRTALTLGLFPIYPHKPQAGLRLTDRDGADLFRARYPQHVYPAADSIPNRVWETLLYIENRELMDTDRPYKNPAVEWDRFLSALFLRLATGDGPGGSTLATQLAKVRHSPDGLTRSPAEKLRQMASASVLAYQDGRRTVEVRRKIVRDYLNSLPLAAAPGHGEVNGLGDGLAVWFGADVDRVNRRLAADTTAREAQGHAYRQVLSLLLSTRSPTRYLVQADGPAALHTLTDQYLRLLARDGVISPALRDAALQAEVTVRDRAPATASPPFVERKAASAIRTDLLGLLGESSLTALDRYDLSARTTFDGDVQRQVTDVLQRLHDPDYLRRQGLIGNRLLASGDPSAVTYSVVLYERDSLANKLRVQADNFPGPFDVNRGSKLELGSTAKLRTLITYLELVEETYDEHRDRPTSELRALTLADTDAITRWVVDQLLRAPDLSRTEILRAAMDRTYSASPNERFRTGGGIHVFRNFSADTGGRMTVETAMRQSVNLVFIRMMRDIVNYHVARLPGQPGHALADPLDDRRTYYLQQFADQEGRLFLRRYYRAYTTGTSLRTPLETFGARHQRSARALAWAYRSVFPEAGRDTFGDYLRRHATDAARLSDDDLGELFSMAQRAQELSWQDRGYLAGVHPLELWLVHYLHIYPTASLSTVVAASTDVRQAVYDWLYRKGKASQDTRIRTMLEQEAFVDIYRRWQRLGYPFERLVPSYATAIGSSADRPAALAELMGLLVRDGQRYPSVRLDSLRFAADTPYETALSRRLPAPTRVLSPELSRTVRHALLGTVEQGTAVRARGAVTTPDGPRLPIGGKTGTGDNRLRGPGGDVALNRTSTFVFFIGDRFFGTVVAYVPGAQAASFTFTSSLVTSLLTIVGPSLTPLLTERDAAAAQQTWTAFQEAEARRPSPTRPPVEEQPLPEETRVAPLPMGPERPTRVPIAPPDPNRP